ncbi:hypothetical protein IFO69_13295 [Echinicola sp. CAU 1574]|uniref:Yip1 domain-containing protein n=1 Tax=Echinicola arenosa TaxID=2774144 RepID=A0ABR9AN51_9BACT|nr:YIP1 family protein [Echinicola arenosa]MBD8489726.1 hypothetical protein [Echinicola arenosa]
MNVYRTIWLKPSPTFEEIANKKEQSLQALPIILFGLVFGLDMYPDMILLLGEKAKIWALVLGLFLGIGFSFLSLGLVMPGLIRIFGKLWKGKSSMRQMVNICSLSFLPLSMVLVYQVSIFIFGLEPTIYNLNAGIVYLLWLW